MDVCCADHFGTWMDSIIDYLQKDAVPNDPQEAKKLRKVSKYVLNAQQLYKQGFSYQLLRCLDSRDVEYAMKERKYIRECVEPISKGGPSLAR
ncbi:hypothetical protein CR513_61557, partial [Mucuna pruriens]